MRGGWELGYRGIEVEGVEEGWDVGKGIELEVEDVGK